MMKRSPCNGMFLVVLGVLFLLNSFNVIAFSFDKYWPLFLILWGLHAFMPCCKEGGGCCKK